MVLTFTNGVEITKVMLLMLTKLLIHVRARVNTNVYKYINEYNTSMNHITLHTY